MAIIGYSLSCEEHGPLDLALYARRAEECGFAYAMISDHYLPWIDAQGSSPFVWAVLGAISQTTRTLPVGTSVTCPLVRYHPALVAQASATVAAMLPGRFTLGLGTGEYLNEHIYGNVWPEHEVRIEMLEEAIAIIRRLWSGDWVSHRGRYFTVENAKLYTRPEQPPPIAVAAGGKRAARLADRSADALINFTPDTKVVEVFGRDRPRYVQLNVCYARDESEARRTAHRVCPNVALQGELGQQLPHPRHFEQVVQLVTEDAVAEVIPCGPDPWRHAEAVQRCLDAGYDHVHVYQVGPDQESFFRFYEREILPKFH